MSTKVEKQSKSSWKTLVVVAVAAALLASGLFLDFGQTEETREASIRFSVSLGVSPVVSEHPEAAEHLLKVASLLEAAAASGDGDVTSLSREIASISGEDNSLLEPAVDYVVARLKAIDTGKLTKEEILGRVKAVALGIKAGVATGLKDSEQ